MYELNYFPTPFDDELLYSVFARYHGSSINFACRETVIDLFGSPTACAVVDLPMRLAALAGRLSPRTLLSSDRLVRDHTLFPLYRLFLPCERIEKVISQMINPALGGRVHATIGQMASRIPSVSFLRYCPHCLVDDVQIFGEPYWHRSHQVHGIQVCHRHGEVLLDSTVRTGAMGIKHGFIALDENQSSYWQTEPIRFQEEQRWLAEAAHQLLNELHEVPAPGLVAIRDRYHWYLTLKGLVSVKGNVNCQELVEQFTAFYPSGFLKSVGCLVADAGPDNWLHKLVRKPRSASHPFHHLLLIRFLGVSVREFLETEPPTPRPFGRGPWPCLNRAADHYRKAMIGKCVITRNSETGAPVGTFACSCGFTYARTGPDRCPEDRRRISRMVAFGPVWEAQLLQLRSEGCSLRATARQLGVDTKTVIKHLAQLQSPSAMIPAVEAVATEREARRARWLVLCDAFPNDGVKALRLQARAAYAWLYRNDREWLRNHSPRRSGTRKLTSRCDWDARDRDLATKISSAVAIIQSRTKPAVRVSVSAIGKELGALALLQVKLDKLPLTRAVLHEVVETREKFARRRIKQAREIFASQGEIPPAWELLRTAGIREDMVVSVSEEVQRLIEDSTF